MLHTECWYFVGNDLCVVPNITDKLLFSAPKDNARLGDKQYFFSSSTATAVPLPPMGRLTACANMVR